MKRLMILIFCMMLLIGCSSDVEDVVEEKTQLLQSLGFNVNLAPVADVSTDPDEVNMEMPQREHNLALVVFGR